MYTGTGTELFGNTIGISPNTNTTPSLYTITSSTTSILTPMNKVKNSKVAVFKIERNNKNEIISAKFIKEMWIETKNEMSIDFEVAKHPDINKYSSDEIAIKVIHTVNF